jgi:uncharacterized membrane protein (DUF2068 family)
MPRLTTPPRPPARRHPPGAAPDRRALRLIAAFKAAKATALLVVAAAAFGLLGASLRAGVTRWLLDAAAQLAAATEIRGLRGALGGRLERALEAVLRWLGDATPRRLEITGLIALLYAAVLGAEGVGLWLARPWAEWYSVGVTASLLPFELWELTRRATPLKAAVLALNVAAVAYLVWRIRRDAEARHDVLRSGTPGPAPDATA